MKHFLHIIVFTILFIGVLLAGCAYQPNIARRSTDDFLANQDDYLSAYTNGEVITLDFVESSSRYADHVNVSFNSTNGPVLYTVYLDEHYHILSTSKNNGSILFPAPSGHHIEQYKNGTLIARDF